jgi:hypothetical protein
MPWLNLPINVPLSENVDDIALGDNRVSERSDIYLDEEGAINKRPGSDLQDADSDFAAGAKVQSEFEWIRKGWMIIVCGGTIYVKKAVTTSPVALTGATLDPNNPVTFADNGTELVMANGGNMVYTTDGVTAIQVTDVDAPTTVSFVAHINGFILALEDDTQKIFNSDLDDATSWAAAQVFQAESNPDKAISMATDQGLIYVWGEKTLEIWYPDGSGDVTPFSRQDVIPRGIIASHSIVRANNTWYWLNEERRLVYLNGTIAQSVSLPFDKAHHDLTTISDAESYLLTIQGRYFIVINFPTENRTHVYDIMLNQWYRWGYWDNRNAELDRSIWNCIVYMQAWGKHFAGSRLGDDLLIIDADVEDDNGRQIRPEEITGWITFGDTVEKQLPRLRLVLARGRVRLDDSDVTVFPTLIMQMRKNGESKWGNQHEIDLGVLGDTYMFATINRLGQARSVQFRFYMTDAAPFVLKGGSGGCQIFVKPGRD